MPAVLVDDGPRGNEETPLIGGGTSASSSTDADDTSRLVGRRVSRFFASHFGSYGQHGSMEDAWDYFEQFVLPRRMQTSDGSFKKAPPGTSAKTSLYNAWCTPQQDLRDFGTGIAVYFETLRALVVICIIAWLLYLPTILYYQSDAFAADQDEDLEDVQLRGSLMCTHTQWVPCPTCIEDDWEPNRIATSEHGLVFVLRNACAPLRWQEGANHFLVLLFLIGAITALGYHQRRLELQYDEDVLTAQDFSIVVSNPPGDAIDPEEWKTFFSQFGNQVTYCTVALDNEDLVASLVKRRTLLQRAGFKLRDRDDSTPLQEIPLALQSKKKFYTNFKKAEEQCRELLKLKYDATSIFITFETEQAQRKALEALIVPKMSVATNDIDAIAPEYRFRGSLVLTVEEADEPSVIRWKDLNETLGVRIVQRVFTGTITVGLIFLGFIAVKHAFEFDLHLAAFLIAILNIVVPNLFKNVNTLESHAGEGSYQASLYAKISIFRFVNTAVVTTIIKPFTATISDDAAALIPAVYAVLKAEIVTAPIVNMLDIVGQFKRHILAPRAENQGAMNSCFRGSAQNLGEKYTNMTKVIFLAFFYSVIFPAGFLFGALAILATYTTDKFLLLRSWGQLPELGDDVAKLSRRFFFPLCLVVLAIVSEFYWSAYPFDNVCESDDVVSSYSHAKFIGTHSVSTMSVSGSSSTSYEVTLHGDGTAKVYYFCDEDYLERISALLTFFQMEKDDWMSVDQQRLTFLFGFLCVGVLVVVGVVALVRDIFPHLRGMVQANFSTLERDSGERFSEQPHIQAYVPQVRHPKFMFPLLVCDITHVEPRHIGWSDPLHDHDFYNLSKDVSFLLSGAHLVLEQPALSVVQHWDNGR